MKPRQGVLVNVLEGGWCLCLVVRNVTKTLERQANNGLIIVA